MEMELRMRSAAKSLPGRIDLLQFYMERGRLKEACDAVMEQVKMRVKECFNSQPWLECATQCFKSYAADTDLRAPMSTCYANLLCKLVELHLHGRNQLDAEIALSDLDCFLAATDWTSPTETHARYLSLAANLLSLRLQYRSVKHTGDARNAAARLYQAAYLLAHKLNTNPNHSTPLLHFIEFEALSMHTYLQSQMRFWANYSSPRRPPTDSKVFDCVFSNKVFLASAMDPLLRSVDSMGGQFPVADSVTARLTELYSNHVSLFDAGSLQRVLWCVAQVWNAQSQTPLADFPFSKALSGLKAVPPNLSKLQTTLLDTFCSIDSMLFFHIALGSSLAANNLNIAARTPYLLMGSMSSDSFVSVWDVVHAVGQSTSGNADQRQILEQLLEFVRCIHTESLGSRLIYNVAIFLEEKAASAENKELSLAFHSYAKLYWNCLISKLETMESPLRRPVFEPNDNLEFSDNEISSILRKARKRASEYELDLTSKPVGYVTLSDEGRDADECRIRMRCRMKLMQELKTENERLKEENRELTQSKRELKNSKERLERSDLSEIIALRKELFQTKNYLQFAERELKAETRARELAQMEVVALRLAMSKMMLERIQGDTDDLKELTQEMTRHQHQATDVLRLMGVAPQKVSAQAAPAQHLSSLVHLLLRLQTLYLDFAIDQ